MLFRGSFLDLSRQLLLALVLVLFSSASWSQEDEEVDAAAEAEAEELAAEEETADLDKVIVTGSRLQRETYTSITPLQIITAQGSREAGLIDAADILQGAPAAGGQQIDLTFSGFVLDNGPGASTVDLRGLGAARTLVLLNGRRLAPSGVEGAPSAPNLNLIPGSLVQQYDLLLDGASSIYGSDAVAGVTNVLMRKDFDGWEFGGYYSHPDEDNGEGVTASIVWGQNTDRGFIGFGAEFDKSDEVRVGDRDMFGECDKNWEVDENGDFRTEDQFYQNVYNMEWDDCRLGLLAARVSVPTAGSVYATPGTSNGGWPGFSDPVHYGFGVDSDQDGVADLSYRDYDFNGKPVEENRTLFPKTKRVSIMAYGEHAFEGEMNNTVFFEAMYNMNDIPNINSGPPQLFPVVPANNPYNICNPNGVNGVDCGQAFNALLNNPGFQAGFADTFADLCAANGIPPQFCTPATFGVYLPNLGPRAVQPIVSVEGDRNLTSVNMEQYRLVLGMKGDLPAIDWGSLSSWVYEFSGSYTTSDGSSHRPGIRNDRLQASLNNTRIDSNGNIVCSTATVYCVPVNMFAPSLYPVGVVTGDFATQAERDYLFDMRDFDTEYTQTIFSAYINGFLFDLPGGTVTGGIGAEYRDDDIKSIPDDVARDGLFFGFFADGGATGSKATKELFGEVELPLLAGVPFAEELIVNLSARYTDDEYYGDDTTWSAKLGWRPVSSLLLRATAGTSFRAPNVRETFLEDQTGFLNTFDPCVVPEDARNPITGGYDPSADNREPEVLQNCVNQGVDPTTLGATPVRFPVYSVEIARGGSDLLDPETSESFTYGFAFEQPWFTGFDLTFGATYYEIEITDTIVEPSSQFLVNDCYNDEQLDSVFCQYIERGADDFISLVNAKYVNRDEAMARGYDINVNFDTDWNVGSTPFRFNADLVLNKPEEVSTTFLDDDGNSDFDESAGELGFPEWKGQLGMRLNINDFRISWITNYIGSTNQDPLSVDPFSDVYAPTDFADTCEGPPDDVQCRDFADTDDYWLHSTSLYWYGDTVTLGIGVRNVFDEKPPYVDGTEYIAINRIPIGYGYDLNGRVYFFEAVWRP
jgi:iron complex outermembrane receptor protein